VRSCPRPLSELPCDVLLCDRDRPGSPHADRTDCHTFWRKSRTAFASEDETLETYLEKAGAYHVPVAQPVQAKPHE